MGLSALGGRCLLALGARAHEAGIVLWQVIAAMDAGTILGSLFLYFLARRNGRSLVERFGPFIGIGAAQLDRAERQLQRHGALAVFLGRLLPGLRILTAFACGIFRVPYSVFLPAMSVGSLIYIVAYRRSVILPVRPFWDCLKHCTCRLDCLVQAARCCCCSPG